MENYKEKYEQLINFIKDLYPYMSKYCREKVEGVCPELKESEDERIRKSLIELVRQSSDALAKQNQNNMIAWLEKQGEQNKQHLYDIIVALWDLLDKIDTFSELKITDTNSDNPFSKIMHITQERHKFVKSDGYDLFINDVKITNYKSLEKQGEQNLANKLEAKFKVGDWITNGDYSYQIIKTDGLDYTLKSQNGAIVVYDIDYIENEFHLWDITKDAKKGDVLYCKKEFIDGKEVIVMYSGINIHNYVDSYCRYNSKLGFNTYITHVLNVEHDFIVPATKEQCDLLFQKMKDVGLEWNAEKKELVEKN